MKRLLLLGPMVIALSGCIHPHPTAYSPVNEGVTSVAASAHATCLEYGAQPGTRMFYRCMKSQMRDHEYNQATSNCTSPQEQLLFQRRCYQTIAIGGPDFFQRIDNCKTILTNQCESQASGEYLHRNNALRIEESQHIYNHQYTHNYGG